MAHMKIASIRNAVVVNSLALGQAISPATVAGQHCTMSLATTAIRFQGTLLTYPHCQLESAEATEKSSFDEQVMQSAQWLCRIFSVVNVHNMQQDQYAMSVRTHNEHHHERHFQTACFNSSLIVFCFLLLHFVDLATKVFCPLC